MTTPGMSEERARAIVKRSWIKSYIESEVEYAKGYLACLEQEREKSKEKDAEIDELKYAIGCVLDFFIQDPVIRATPNKPGWERKFREFYRENVAALESSRQEIERLKQEVKKFQDELEKAWAQHDSAILKLSSEIENLRKTGNAEGELISCVADLANTWAREAGVEECKSPFSGLSLRDLIDRLWVKYSVESQSTGEMVATLEKIAGDKEFSHHADGKFVRLVWYVEEAKRVLARHKAGGKAT